MTPKPPVDEFTLNPALDREKLAAHYARHGRIHIPAILTPDSAARLHKMLNEETAYNLTVNSGEKYFDLPEAQVRALSPHQLQALADSAGAGTQKGFQLYYETHRLTESGEPYRDPKSVLAGIRRALKPGGRLVLVEYRGEDASVPIKPEHKMTLAQVRGELEPLGWRFARSLEFLPDQHVIIFQ